MAGSNTRKPQRTILFRIIAFFTHLQIGYLVRSMKDPRLVVILFAVSAGVAALGILTTVAYLTNLPLVFPPLAATTFILFNTPMSERASPRTVVSAHTMALFSGLASFLLLMAFYPGSDMLNPSAMSWPRVAAIALAMGITSVLMMVLKCVHPPAAATALIASMGYIVNAAQVFGFVAAVVLLVSEAYLFNNVIGGIPYPRWRYNPKAAEEYSELANLLDSKTTFWGQLSTRIVRRR